jgi:hypothetical protein
VNGSHFPKWQTKTGSGFLTMLMMSVTSFFDGCWLLEGHTKYKYASSHAIHQDDDRESEAVLLGT